MSVKKSPYQVLGLVWSRRAAFPISIGTMSISPAGVAWQCARSTLYLSTYPFVRKFCQSRQRISQRPGTVIALDITVYTEYSDTRFFTSGYRGNGARTVRHLCIVLYVLIRARCGK